MACSPNQDDSFSNQPQSSLTPTGGTQPQLLSSDQFSSFPSSETNHSLLDTPAVTNLTSLVPKKDSNITASVMVESKDLSFSPTSTCFSSSTSSTPSFSSTSSSSSSSSSTSESSGSSSILFSQRILESKQDQTATSKAPRTITKTSARVNTMKVGANKCLLDMPIEILEEIIFRLESPRNFSRTCHQIFNLMNSTSLRAKYLWLIHGRDQVLTRKVVEQHKTTNSILTSSVTMLLMTMGATHRDSEEFIFRWACSKGYLDVISYLLQSNPKIDLHFRSDWFLREAAKNGRQDAVSLILQQTDYIPSESGLNKAFEAAYEQSHCNTVKALFKYAETKGAHVDHSSPSTQITTSSVERFKRVLAGGLNIQKDSDKALRYAVRGNDLEMVRILLDYGADVHAFSEESIMVAAHKGYVEILKLLIQAGADFETKAGGPLRQAAEGGHAEAVRVLCESGADTLWSGCSALRTAASHGYDSIIGTLLDHGANVNIHEGTPLQLACQHGHEAAVRVLLKYGANHRLDDGAAYKLALEANHEGIQALLVQAETAMRAKERELHRIMQQQNPMIMAHQQQQQYHMCTPNSSFISSSPGGNFVPASIDTVSRGHKRFYSQMSNPLSMSDLFRSGSVCGLVALDDEIRSRQRSERNRL